MSHKRTCPAYGNYQPPYEKCNCGEDEREALTPRKSFENCSHGLCVARATKMVCPIHTADQVLERVDQIVREFFIRHNGSTFSYSAYITLIEQIKQTI